MAKAVYKNYQLQRTLPKLSGNMQLDLVLGFDNEGAYVEQAHLRPLSKYVNYAPVVDERIMDRPHHLNIKRFYEQTKAGFFSQPANPSLTSDWPMLISAAEMPNIKYIKEFDDTYYAGCQRMSHKLYGTTHEILVPVWLDQCSGIRFTIHASNADPRSKQVDTRYIELDLMDSEGRPKFHQDFVKYLAEFFDYVNISKGSNNVMSVNFKQNIATISGLLVESGNYATRQSLNICRNLLYRERPLLEANSLLTNTFMDYKMICPQLINFNLCINVNDLIGGWFPEKFNRVNVWVTTEIICNGSKMTLPLADFYTNHYFVPKQRLGKTSKETFDVYDDTQYPRNVLDYKNDFMCTAMMHSNKMVQSICHWYYADQPEDMLFNVYDGFGAYGDGFEFNHGYGSMVDSNDDVYDESVDNTGWTGRIPEVQSEQNTANILNDPQPYVQSGYFKDASNFINGIKFTYDPSMAGYNPNSNRNAPSAVYFGTATSPATSGQFVNWTAQTTILDNPTTIAILNRRDSALRSDDLPLTQDKQKALKDIQRDWHKYSDMDNRFVVRKKNGDSKLRAYFDPTGEYLKDKTWVWLDPSKTGNIDSKLLKDVKNPNYNGDITYSMLVRIGGSADMDLSYRNEDNVNGLFVTYLRTPLVKGERRKDDPLYVIFWTKKSEKTTPTGDGMIYRKYTPDAILLGSIQNEVREYWRKYGPIYDMIKLMADAKDIDMPSDLPDMDDFKVIVDIMANIEPADVLYFNNSIEESKDITISHKAQEIEYFKNNNANSYVWRYAGKIKPAIYPIDTIGGPRVERKESDSTSLRYRSWYGRNFIWHKEPIFSIGQLTPPNIAQYIGKNIAPTYPSLDYEVVNQLITTGYRPNSHGDILYDEVPHIYLGLTNDSHNKHEFSAANFGFERLNDIDNPFSFVRNILCKDLQDYGVTDYNELMHNSEYNADARKAVLNNSFNINMLTGRTSNAIGYWLYAPEYSTYEWAEFKWFGRSYAINLPESFSYESTAVSNNDKETLENELIKNIMADLRALNPAVTGLCDKALLKSTYDFYFDLIETLPTNELRDVEPLFIYNIKATLK